MSYSASALRTKTRSKISTPGIYTGLKMIDPIKEDKRLVFEFETSEGQYQNISIWYKIDPASIEKGQKTMFERKSLVPSGSDFQAAVKKAIVTAENAVISKLIEIADAVGDEEEVSKVEGKDYMDLVAKLYKYITTLKTTNAVNIKVLMDKDCVWTELPRGTGSIEKYVAGKDPKLKFTTWEISNDRDRRIEIKPLFTGSKGSSKSDEDFASLLGESKPAETKATGTAVFETSEPLKPQDEEDTLPF